MAFGTNFAFFGGLLAAFALGAGLARVHSGFAATAGFLFAFTGHQRRSAHHQR